MEGLVLVVEDNPDMRESLIALLQALGFAAVGACHGEEALALLSRIERPILILLDLSMPVMDGEEFRARQLADPALAEIPVVLVSAEAELQRKAALLRIDDAISKPIEYSHLESILTRHYQQHEARP